mgnify:FL=1
MWRPAKEELSTPFTDAMHVFDDVRYCGNCNWTFGGSNGS